MSRSFEDRGGRSPLIIKDLDLYPQPPLNTRSPTLNSEEPFNQFELLGVDITAADVVVVKIGYLEPDLYDTQKGWLMALTPGGVDQDLIRLGHHKIDRPMFPFDPDMDDPDLSAHVVVP